MPPPRHGAASCGRPAFFARLALAASLALLAAACMPLAPATAPATSDRTWQITDFRLPAVSALDEAGAEGWRGAFVHLQPHRSTNARQTCDRPVYTERTHVAGPFLDTEYRVAADAQVRVFDVICDGQPWAALGGRVLSFGAAGEFAVWEGVFFTLRRVYL